MTEEEIRTFGNRHRKSQQRQKDDKEQNVAEAERAIETTEEIEAQKTTESHNEVQKVSENEIVPQKHWNQANDTHNVAEAKKTETNTVAADETGKKSVATRSDSNDLSTMDEVSVKMVTARFKTTPTQRSPSLSCSQPKFSRGVLWRTSRDSQWTIHNCDPAQRVSS